VKREGAAGNRRALRAFRARDQRAGGIGFTGGPLPLPTNTVTGASKEKNVALAAALMAGSTFAIDQHWLIDVNYRALYLGGIDVTTSTNSVFGDVSKATIDGGWEHQVRIGLRYNIW